MLAAWRLGAEPSRKVGLLEKGPLHVPLYATGFINQNSENMATDVPSILERIAAAGTAYGDAQIGSRETLIELGRDLVAALEIPSEFLQRSFWAEVSSSVRYTLLYIVLITVARTFSALQIRCPGQIVPAPSTCW